MCKPPGVKLFIFCKLGRSQAGRESVPCIVLTLPERLLSEYLLSNHQSGITVMGNYDNLEMYLRIIVLLYADDTVIVTGSDKDLQNALDDFSNYYQEWKLKVNISKNKGSDIWCQEY